MESAREKKIDDHSDAHKKKSNNKWINKLHIATEKSWMVGDVGVFYLRFDRLEWLSFWIMDLRLR